MPVDEKYLQPFAGLDVSAEQQARAVRAVASGAENADDCRTLLEMLGLNAGLLAADRSQVDGDPTGPRAGVSARAARR